MSNNPLQFSGMHTPAADASELRVPIALVGAWVLVMISVPILNWTLGETAMLRGVTLGVFAQAAAVVATLRLVWDWREIGRIFLIVALFTLAVEAIGTRTGFPFGAYVYTDRLQPQVLHVPVVIPFAWFMMLPSAWVIANRWRHNRWQFAAVSAAALTAWDLFLDPQMVGWQLWQWANPSGYFGIPWSNYAGWLATAFVLSWLLWRSATTITPVRRVALPLIGIYGVTWFLEWFGLIFFWGQPLPGIVGAIVMGGFLWLGLKQYVSKPHN